MPGFSAQTSTLSSGSSRRSNSRPARASRSGLSSPSRRSSSDRKRILYRSVRAACDMKTVSLAGISRAEIAEFQDGLDGYTGAQDTSLQIRVSGKRADRNFGGTVYTGLGNPRWGREDNYVRGLMRWDLSSLAGMYTTIHSVTLTLTLSGDSTGTGTFYVYALKEANADWVEGTGTGALSDNVEGDCTWRDKAWDGLAAWAGEGGAASSSTAPRLRKVSRSFSPMRWWPPAVRRAGNRPDRIHLRTVSGLTEQRSAACPVVRYFCIIGDIVEIGVFWNFWFYYFDL